MTGILFIHLLFAGLVDDLGHERFARRQAAERALTATIDLSLPWIQAARTHEDAEVRRRVHDLLASADAVISIPDRYPWIDMLPCDHDARHGVMERWLTEARSCLVSEICGFPDWPEYRYATWLYLRDLGRQGVRRAELKGLLQSMNENEARYRERHAAHQQID